MNVFPINNSDAGKYIICNKNILLDGEGNSCTNNTINDVYSDVLTVVNSLNESLIIIDVKIQLQYLYKLLKQKW